MPILIFLGLSVLELFRMYVTDVRQTETDVRQLITGGGIITLAVRRVLYVYMSGGVRSNVEDSRASVSGTIYFSS